MLTCGHGGEWHEDLASGMGSLIWSDGASYEGQFLNDRRHGHGSMTYGDGTKYVGSWLCGVRDGSGTLLNVDGSEVQLAVLMIGIDLVTTTLQATNEIGINSALTTNGNPLYITAADLGLDGSVQSGHLHLKGIYSWT